MGVYHRTVDRFVRSRIGGWVVLRVLTPLDVRLMRATGGRINTGFGTDFARRQVLLRCTGARSGALREVPLLATEAGEDYLLVASATGQAAHPGWYHNLRAHPDCSLLVAGRGEVALRARELHGDERDAAWRAASSAYGGYEVYRTRTDRRIGVFRLERR